MKVLITKRFEKEYLKKLTKYLSKNDLVKILNNKSHILISLHDPFFKFKNKINLVDFRGVIAIIENEVIVPLYVYLKKGKKNGENVSWKNQQDLIEIEFDLNTKDIENGNYEIY
ncbi:MAG: hypothetical protein Q8K30_02180 [Candidatus Gracilibacteria bacterium]|nr:hypothetical protein [Candidatus Gracilibacteria bacterium]